jgi:DNA-binding XRE family transcriptional regulator
MGRVEQKYLFLTTPGVHQIDADIRAMADVWVLVREVGRAQMYRVRFNPFEGRPLTDNWGVLRWPDARPAETEPTYQELTRRKRAALRGEGDEAAGYVNAAEAQESAEEAAEKAERQKRNELLRQIYEQNDDMTQQELADSVGLSRSRVADILRGD